MSGAGVRVAPPRRNLVGTWFACVVLFGVLLVASQVAEGPLDDVDPSYQRPGFLDAGGLPVAPPPPEEIGLDLRWPAVVFFERPARVPSLCSSLADEPITGLTEASVVVVASGDGRDGTGRCPPEIAVVADPRSELARQFGLRQPRDGGPPVGYAVVDSSGLIRYATLDPETPSLLGEVRTMLRAAG